MEMMEPGTERAIGRLEGKLDALIETVREQGDRSDAGRQRMYTRMETLGNELVSLKNKTSRIEHRLDDIEPLATEFAKLKQRGLGIIGVLGLAWLVCGSLVLSGVSAAASWLIRAAGSGH